MHQTARELTDLLIDDVCDGVTVYVLQRLLIDDQAPVLLASESRVVVRRLALNWAIDGAQDLRSAYPVDEVVAYAPSTPYAKAMNTGRPVTFTDMDSQTLGRLKDRAFTRPESPRCSGSTASW